VLRNQPRRREMKMVSRMSERDRISRLRIAQEDDITFPRFRFQASHHFFEHRWFPTYLDNWSKYNISIRDFFNAVLTLEQTFPLRHHRVNPTIWLVSVI